MHEYYAKECNNSVHLTLEISLQGLRMGLKAYACVLLGVPGGKTGCIFTPINFDVICFELEVIILLASLRC
jgi:translation initiation factor 3 subunit F